MAHGARRHPSLAGRGAAGMGRVTSQNVMPLVGDIGICVLFGIATLLVGLVLGRSRGRSELA